MPQKNLSARLGQGVGGGLGGARFKLGLPNKVSDTEGLKSCCAARTDGRTDEIVPPHQELFQFTWLILSVKTK